jgi:hypothetical protein
VSNDPGKPGSSPGRWDGLIILVVLSVLEVVILYVLIAVDTPLAPVVRKLIRNPGGLFAVVMAAVTLLCIGMALFLGWAERRSRGRSRVST